MKTVKVFSYFAISLILGLGSTASAEGIATMFPVDEIEFAEDNAPELMDNKMVLLDDAGEVVCSIPFGLDTSEDMIADDIKPCSEEDLLSLTMTMPLEEGEVAALPLLPIAIGVGTAIFGCAMGYIGAGTPKAQPSMANNNSEDELRLQELTDSQGDLSDIDIILDAVTFASVTAAGLSFDLVNDSFREYRLLKKAMERVNLPNRSQLQNDRLLSRMFERITTRRPIIDGLRATRFRMTITGTLSAVACYGARTYWQ